MKRLAFFAVFCGACVMGVAGPVQQWGRPSVKSVKIYPAGVYVTMSVKAALQGGGAAEEIVFPDLWYADPATVELKLMPGATGVTYVTESQRAVRGNDVELQRRNLTLRDSLLARKARLEADSMVLVREVEFLQANAKQAAGSVAQLAAANGWMRDRYAVVYESQRRNRAARAALDREMATNARRIQGVDAQASRVTLVRARANSQRAQQAEFELSYFANVAEWKPVYFFRFDPGRASAELDYQAAVRQSTRFDWSAVAAELNYGMPKQALNRRDLWRQTVGYIPPAPKVKSRPNDGILDLDVTQELAVNVAKFGGNYVAETEEFSYAAPTARAEVSENNVSYHLPMPLTLASSSDEGQIFQTVQVRRDTIPVLYNYEVTPKISREVLLVARLPEWQKLHLADGQMNIFCDGRMLGQSNLSVRSATDTLELPLMVEPLVVVDRSEVGDYKERVSGAKLEQMRSYEIKIKNNKSFPVNLTVKDQYPVSNTDQVEVTLVESGEAQVDVASGMLTWRMVLAPGQTKTLTFTYSVRYPKEGAITGYY